MVLLKVNGVELGIEEGKHVFCEGPQQGDSHWCQWENLPPELQKRFSRLSKGLAKTIEKFKAELQAPFAAVSVQYSEGASDTPELIQDAHIFTDGACRGNPGPGGWGVVIKQGDTVRERSGAEADTTNNRMELTAAIEGLKALSMASKVILTTDSAYLKSGITVWIETWKKNGWITSNRKPVLNKDLWEELDAQNQRHEVKWKWVKGHAGHSENEKADTVANTAIERLLSGNARLSAAV